MNSMKVIVLSVALSAGCRFPELPPLDVDAAVEDGAAFNDAGGPSVSITSGPASSSVTGPRVSFEFTAQGGTPSCRFDQQPLLACTSPVTINLSEGIHSFLVQVMSPSGTVVSDTRLWNVDCVPPAGDAMTFGLFHMDEATGDTLVNSRPFQNPPPSRDALLGTGSTTYRPTRITPGRFGTGGIRFVAYALNETDRITLSTLLDPPDSDNIGAHSIEMWANPTPSFPNELYLWQATPSPQAGRLTYRIKFIRNGATGHFRLETRGADGLDRNIDSQAVEVGVYHHLVFSYTPGTAPMLFVDGVQRELAESVNGTFDVATSDIFGRFEGDLDELHLTFHAFTEEEVLDRWCPP
jgi:hypothetical protein